MIFQLATLIALTLVGQQATPPSPHALYSGKVDQVFYANGFQDHPLAKLTIRGSGLFVYNVTVENHSDEAVYVMAESANIPDPDAQLPSSGAGYIDFLFPFGKLVKTHSSVPTGIGGEDFVIDAWAPLCPTTPFTRLEPGTTRMLRLFSENLPKLPPYVNDQKPTSIRLEFLTSDQREAVMNQTDPAEQPTEVIPAFQHVLSQIRIALGLNPLARSIDIPIESSSWDAGDREASDNGFFFRSG